MGFENIQQVGEKIRKWGVDCTVAALKRVDCDAAIVATVPNVFYLTGYSSLSHRLLGRVPVFTVLSRDNTTHLVLPSSDCDLVAEYRPQVDTLNLYGTFFVAPASGQQEMSNEEHTLSEFLSHMRSGRNWLEALGAAIEESKLTSARVLFDEDGITPIQFESIRNAFPEIDFAPGSKILRECRSVKSPLEVELLREASSVTERAITTALQHIQEDSTDYDLYLQFLSTIVQYDAQPFFEVISCGSSTSMPNVEPAGRALRRNSIIRFDVGCKYKMYCSDIARNAVLGEIPTKVRKYYKAILAGLEKGLEVLRPGLTASALFNVMVETVRENGIPHYERHHCGHGIGMEGYEIPLIAPHDETVLKEGMVLCLETPYYELGFGGLQVEDMVLVTHDGFEQLTQLSRDILTV